MKKSIEAIVGLPAFQSAIEWANAHKGPPQIVEPTRYLRDRLGWLDENTPCFCDRLVMVHNGNSRLRQSRLIEAILSTPSRPAICTFDPKDIVTKGQ